MLSPAFVQLPVHAHSALVVHLYPVHAHIAASADRVAGDDRGHGDVGTAIFRPAGKDGDAGQGRFGARFHHLLHGTAAHDVRFESDAAQRSHQVGGASHGRA